VVIAVVAAIPSAATAIWVLAQTFEKIANFSLNRDILKLTREKLRRDLATHEPSTGAIPEVNYEQFVERVRVRDPETEYTFTKIERHLKDSPIRIREIDLSYVRELPSKKK